MISKINNSHIRFSSSNVHSHTSPKGNHKWKSYHAGKDHVNDYSNIYIKFCLVAYRAATGGWNELHGRTC
jgi:hypothetical protein